jgi:5-formyltetrahydrofolate cyclo-ligase
MTIRAAKRALRRAAVARILALGAEDRRRQDAALLACLPHLPGFAEAATVLLYASAFPEEIDTRPMLDLARADGKRLACPRVDGPTRRLLLFTIDDPAHDLIPGTLGIPEPRQDLTPIDPSAIDWALIPGLAFDQHGFRLGRGAGCYDRLLPELRPDAPRWALLLEPQWVDRLPVEPHDQRLDGAVSPQTMRTWVRGAL